MDLKKVGTGIVSFFSGVFLMMIILPVMNPIMTALNAGTYAIGDSAEATIWVGVILLWALLTIILPAYCIHTGISTDIGKSKGLKLITAGLIFFFSIMITYQAWFMLTGISDAMTTNAQRAFYWTGLITNWIMITIITPAYLIWDSTKTE